MKKHIINKNAGPWSYTIGFIVGCNCSALLGVNFFMAIFFGLISGMSIAFVPSTYFKNKQKS